MTDDVVDGEHAVIATVHGALCRVAIRTEGDVAVSWSIHCHDAGCVGYLTLSHSTTEETSDEDDYVLLAPALGQAAASMGWRVHQCAWWCPTHVASRLLACADCISPCPTCSCPGGPMADAIPGMFEP